MGNTEKKTCEDGLQEIGYILINPGYSRSNPVSLMDDLTSSKYASGANERGVTLQAVFK